MADITIPFFHFDFGENLRSLADHAGPHGDFSSEEIQFINRVLHEGALLENKDFPLARKVFNRFVDSIRPNTHAFRMVLNGLPRHIDQARKMEAWADMRLIVELHCTVQILEQRIKENPAGDRTNRKDDLPELVQRKIRTYRERTEPLLAYYRDRGVPVLTVEIDAKTDSAGIADRIIRSLM